MNFQAWFTFGLVVAASAVHVNSDPFPFTDEAGWHAGTIEQENNIRHFRCYVPKGLGAGSPLLILLHAGNQGMFKVFGPTGGGAREWQRIADEVPLLLLVPNGVNPETGDPAGDNQSWNDCRAERPGARRLSKADDVGFIRDLIERAARDFRIDRNQVYVTGASNGGMMCYRLAMELGSALAAVAAFNANLPAEGECEPANTPVPIMIVNSPTDPLIPWMGGVIAGTPILSALETRDYWVGVNKAEPAKAEIETLPDRDAHDSSTVIRERYPAGEGGVEVLFYRVEGAGHLMPSINHQVIRPEFGRQNRDMEGAREAWEFFRRQTRKSDHGDRVPCGSGRAL